MKRNDNMKRRGPISEKGVATTFIPDHQDQNADGSTTQVCKMGDTTLLA
jgi:hypothetical protein